MRIAHLTDPHIRRAIPGPSSHPERRSRESADILIRALADARERGADVVVLTGDVVDIPPHLFSPERPSTFGDGADADAQHGNPADAALWRAVREDYRWVREQLDGCGLPWIALPGNHDSIGLLRQELGAGSAGPGTGPTDCVIAGVRLVSFWDREHDLHVPRRVLEERRRLESVLADPDPTTQVHLQHYVIAPDLDLGYPLNYLETHELRDRIASSDSVALSLSGHHHAGAEPEQHGSTLFSVTPALTEEPHPYRLFDVDPAAPIGERVSWEQVDLAPAGDPTPTVFLDRDGCINTLPAYWAGPESMELLPGSGPAIRRLRAAGYRIVVVTNQTCVGLGYVTPGLLHEVHERLHALLAQEGAELDAIYASFDAADAAVAGRYRETDLPHKPDPTMILRAAEQLNLDLTRSFMVGDRPGDVHVGLNAGTTPILVRTGSGHAAEETLRAEGSDVLVVDSLAHAAQAILGTPGT
jgi:histidinol-phosphate phosphatase family protein